MDSRTIIPDPVFAEAVNAIDNGDEAGLGRLLDAHPSLLQDPLDLPEEGYFRNPYLLWFVAGNPIRRERLVENIAEIAGLLIGKLKALAPDSQQHQLDYTLALVCSGRVPRESGVQQTLIDVLIDAGADPNQGIRPAIPHHELGALAHILDRGAVMTLGAAIALDRREEVIKLMGDAGKETMQTGLAVAAFYGRPEYVRLLLDGGVDINAYNPEGYHSHSTALHQAVWAGAFETVQLLVKAGADIGIRDRIYAGTALGWAEHGLYSATKEEPDPVMAKKYREIAGWLTTFLQKGLSG